MAEILDEQQFEQKVENGKGLALVDFYADWCVPCQMMAPVVEKLSEANAGKAAVYKVNTEDSVQAAIRHNVTNIPSFILFKDGKKVDMVVGTADKSELQAMIDRNCCQ